MADVSAVYSPPSGTSVVTLSGTVVSDAQFGTQPVVGDQVVYPDAIAVDAQLNITGPNDAYTLYHVQQDGTTTDEAYNLTGQPDQASTTATYTLGASYTQVTLQDPVDPYLFEGWATAPVEGEQLATLTADGAFDVNGNFQTDQEAVIPVIFVGLDGATYDLTIDTTGLESLDITPPTIAGVEVPAAASYKAAETLSFTANTSEPVTVTGVPVLNLDIGGTSRKASYVSGSGSTAELSSNLVYGHQAAFLSD